MITLPTATNVQPYSPHTLNARRVLTMATLVIAIICLMTGATVAGKADDDDDDDDSERGGRGGFCSQTAHALFRSCRFEAQDDLYKERAICLNVVDNAKRTQCRADTTTAFNESRQLCNARRTARLEACKVLGEDRYEPNFDPALFDDPKHPTHPNPYFPLTVGNRWEYAGESEAVAIEVLNATKLIDGVTCLVVRDQVSNDGEIVEDTDDWFAQAKSGEVFYCGEAVKDLESFAGDNPRVPEIVSRDGSFKHGRDGDKGGIAFLGSPIPGKVYRQEFSVNNAEDIAEVVSTTYGFGSNPTLDKFVPQQLARLLCSGDCVVTKEYTPREPGIVAYKYYARGIGFFLEVKPDTGTPIQLVNCNFATRCTSLPQP